jgi:hypothetical protein
LAMFMIVVLVGVASLRNLFLVHTSKVRLVALLVAISAFYPWDTRNPPFPVSLFPEANAARMAFVSTGVTVDLLVSMSLWWSSQPDRRERASWGYFIGYVPISCSPSLSLFPLPPSLLLSLPSPLPSFSSPSLFSCLLRD